MPFVKTRKRYRGGGEWARAGRLTLQRRKYAPQLTRTRPARGGEVWRGRGLAAEAAVGCESKGGYPRPAGLGAADAWERRRGRQKQVWRCDLG